MSRSRWRRIVGWFFGAIAILLVVLLGAVLVYANVGRMEPEAGPLETVTSSTAVTLTDHGAAWALSPTGPANGEGLVFIPGAKVAPLAYASMLEPIAAAGTEVVIVKPPLRLAIVDLRSPDTFTNLAPSVTSWAVGGHSLGGVKACQWAADPAFDELILFGSYCADDVSTTDLDVLSIAGSEDGLSTPEKIKDARDLLPADATMLEIEGASHASFGSYGEQEGDGTPTISESDAHQQIASAVSEFLAAHEG